MQEELDKLTAEAQELSSKVAYMRRRHHPEPDPEIVASSDQNAQLKQLLHQQRYSLWRVNNIVSDWLVRALAYKRGLLIERLTLSVCL